MINILEMDVRLLLILEFEILEAYMNTIYFFNISQRKVILKPTVQMLRCNLYAANPFNFRPSRVL